MDVQRQDPGAGGLDGLAVGAALVTVVLWASAFVGIRAVAPDLSPGALAFGRLLIGSLALGVVILVRRPAMPPGRAVPLIVACGVLWFGLYSLALNTAERHVDAGTAAMLVNVGPILIAVLGGLFLGEGFPPRLLVGCLIAFAGAVTIGLATSSGAAGDDATLGIVLCLVAAVAYATGVTLQKPVVASTPALTVTWLSCIVGALVCLPFAPQLVTEVGAAQPSAVAWLVYLGLFPTALAFTTWTFALGRTTAGRLGSTTYLVPAIAVGLGWLLLGEVPPPLAILGGAVAISGVVIARWAPSRPRSLEPALERSR
ncbi:MAG TPA: DMT family transporter [Candidatus Limnocylindrales bacterium]|nr:DMT family transporter [Candidatus Limnocylindrales bacterium]